VGLLDGKTLLVTGVLTQASLAFHAATVAQEHGAEVVLTAYARPALTERLATRLPRPAPVIELDVTRSDHLDSLAERVRPHAPRLDGVLHAVAFAPREAMGGDLAGTPWSEVATTIQASAYSLPALVAATRPMMSRGGSVVALSFDSSVAWPDYDWMGVAKSALESSARYLARDLGPAGIRVNVVSAGPLNTLAARSIPGSDGEGLAGEWDKRAPLGWDPYDGSPVGRACAALFSDLLDMTTGEIVHVDGGVHAMGW
jgi:meromycolic acid enoyl-[acyl-carrier-protein] reductase